MSTDVIREFVECRACDGLDSDCDSCGGSGGGMQTFEVCSVCDVAQEWCAICGGYSCACSDCGCGGEE